MRLEELATPRPRAGEVASDVQHCDACHTERAESLGRDTHGELIDRRRATTNKKITGGRGVDVAFEALGSVRPSPALATRSPKAVKS